MKNLVIKTVVITLASIVGLMAIAFSVLSILAPKTTADIFDNLGAKNASIFLYQVEYEKTDDIQVLLDIIDKTYENQDTIRQEKYLEMLISRQDFNSFCSSSDKENLGKDNYSVTAKELYYAHYTSALFENFKFDKAIEVAKEFVKSNGYSQYNPLSVLLDEFSISFTNEQMNQIESAIKDAKCKNNEQKEYKNKDLKYIKYLNTLN